MEAPSARGARWNRGFRLLPRTVRQWAPALLRAAGKHHGLPYECLRRASEGESLFWSGAEAFYESQKAALLTPWVRERLGSLSSYEVVAAHRQRFLERSPLPDFLTWMGYMDLKLRLPELLLMRGDKMSMATSVGAGVPLPRSSPGGSKASASRWPRGSCGNWDLWCGTRPASSPPTSRTSTWDM